MEGDWDAGFGDADLPQPHVSLGVAPGGVSLGSGGALMCVCRASPMAHVTVLPFPMRKNINSFPLTKGETEAQKGCSSHPMPEEG